MWKLHNLWKAYTQNVSYFASIILVLFSDNKNKDLEIKHRGRVMCEDIPPAIVIKWVGMEAMTPTIPQWTLRILESLQPNQSWRTIEALLKFVRLSGENSYFIKTGNNLEWRRLEANLQKKFIPGPLFLKNSMRFFQRALQEV